MRKPEPQPHPLAALIACVAGAQQGDRDREARGERRTPAPPETWPWEDAAPRERPKTREVGK